MVNTINLVSFLQIVVRGPCSRIDSCCVFQGVVTLVEHPDQLNGLKADPSLAKRFVEELCRFHTTSSFATRRVAKVDIKIQNKVRNSQ